MKPLPKFIIVTSVVLGVIFAGKYAVSMLPKSEPAVAPAPVVAVPAEKSAEGQAAIAATPAPAPTVAPAVEPAPTLTPAPTNDAGLANVLGSTKK